MIKEGVGKEVEVATPDVKGLRVGALQPLVVHG